ncbi:hypothetical protein RclHR1_04570013 [Rhizophagus clarus]|uniref:Kinase-like domain-containing protein n=1 Tax=Rhizophagus clarus TaxID=94130 RepID=A0A2Z6RIB2_9GLOM|nr:hypothetical protein RclHR1_04570013 [Rhizophagus clarus]GES87001.1 kinase-like domain-containing protein [Rhizophagus clarus]
METEFNKLNISDIENCSYCSKPFTEESWCKECDPLRIMEGWTSGNPYVDKFIKDTMYKPIMEYGRCVQFLEWVPYDRFTDMKEIGEGGFAKVYSATWIDGKSEYYEKNDGTWLKADPDPMTVALKKLNGSQNISEEYLNELRIHWNLYKDLGLRFHGMSKDPETKEFIMIIRLAERGNLRNNLTDNFNSILWKEKILLLRHLLKDLKGLHTLGYFHKDFHSGNVLQTSSSYYISDFGLSGPASEQKSGDKIYGILPYVAPEVLAGEPYTSSSDIYSLGILMTEISSGNPPFHNKKYDINLVLDICKGLRPEFGKGTPEIYKRIAYNCMNADSNKRPTTVELYDVLDFWYSSIRDDGEEEEKFGYKRKEIKEAFEKADREIPNISTSRKKNSDVIYTSSQLTFDNLPKPVNSSAFTSYIDNEVFDSQLIDMVISDEIQLEDNDDENDENNDYELN